MNVNDIKIWVEVESDNVLKEQHWMQVNSDKPIKISKDKWFDLYENATTIVLQPRYVTKQNL